MKSQVLVGADQFMKALAQKASKARHSLYVQAMTFEGDVAGEELINLMISSPARDRRLIVDSFSKVVVSDHFVFGTKYLQDAEFRKEVKNTYALLRKARSQGVQVKFVNPTTPLMMRYPLRNHKKMMIVDGSVSYLGGINFSDHNFEWYDMMVEVHNELLGASLSKDFLHTWSGNNYSKKVKVDAGELFLLNGKKSKLLYDEIFEVIKTAKSKVSVISPYISEPLLEILAKTSSSGIEVEILSPKENNKGLFHDYLIAQSKNASFTLKHHPGMFHLKAMLIDDRYLVFGSSNYDLISYYFEQEVVLVSEDKDLIGDFKSKVLTPMRNVSSIYHSDASPSMKPKLIMTLLKGFCKVASNSFLSPRF